VVIGGGDGGAVTEACRHTDLKEIILCEIDQDVVNVSREFFPDLSNGLGDPRVTCVFEEGGAWLATQQERFDVIAVDGTDPIGPGVALFEEDFYRRAAAALRPGGIYVQQIESPFYSIRPGDMAFDLSFEEIVARARRVFNRVKIYCATIPMYIGSYWAFLYAGDEKLLMKPCLERWEKIRGQTRYYSPEMQEAAFVLPPFVEELIR
jgi:spermidine synthase